MAASPRSARSRSVAGLGTLLLGLLTMSALAVGIAARLRQTLPAARDAVRVDQLVEPGVLVVGVAFALWLAGSFLVALLCAMARLVGGTWRAGEKVVARSAPTLVRRSLAVVVSAGLGLTLATGAQASEPPGADLGWVATATTSAPTAPSSVPTAPSSSADGATRTSVVSVPTTADDLGEHDGAGPDDGSPSLGATGTTAAPTAGVPVAPEPATLPAQEPATLPAPAATGPVVVQVGDSLWRIAARELPPDASDAEIDASWRAWYAANADVVGADPDLVLPGQALQRPASPSDPTPADQPTSTTDGAS